MTSSQHKKRQDIHSVPDRGFAGKSPMVSGMLMKKDQLMASAVLLRTVSLAVTSSQAQAQYASKLHSLAREISGVRRSERISSMIDEAMREEQSKKPETSREALGMALERKGIRAEIVGHKEGTLYSFFTIELVGRERKIPFPNSIMDGEPVAEFERILWTMSIVSSNGELMKCRQDEMGSYRPPAEPIEVDLKLLEKRKISYDGKIGPNLMQFSYYADGINTSIAIYGDLKNGELVAEIDRRIVEMHEKFDIPLDVSVVEQQACEKPRFRVPQDDEVERIANTLHMLSDTLVDWRIVPVEYREAIAKLRSSNEFYAAKAAVRITREDAAEFTEAFRLLDNPAHAMARMLHPYYCGENGELSEEGREIVRQTLELGEKGKLDIDGAALSNIATAFSLLTGQDLAGLGEEALREKHLAMMFTIRTRMKEITGNRIFKPASA
jgi:hypothetical protein